MIGFSSRLFYATFLSAFCLSAAHAAPLSEQMLGGAFLDLGDSAVARVLTSKYVCSGILVGPSVVLTSAHCLEERSVGDYKVLVGRLEYSARAVHMNPGFNLNAQDVTEATIKNDIGVILLSSEVQNINPVPVVVNDAVVRGETATMYGYGTNERTDAQQSSDLFVGKAGKVLIEETIPGVLLASSKTSAATSCHGDSGGALLQQPGGFFGVVGLISAGTNDTKDDGVCVNAESVSLSAFTDLQSSIAAEFLANFPGIRYVNGKFAQLSSRLSLIEKELSKLGKVKSPTQVKSKALGLSRKVSKLRSLADGSRSGALGTIISVLKSTAKTGSTQRIGEAVEAVAFLRSLGLT